MWRESIFSCQKIALKRREWYIKFLKLLKKTTNSENEIDECILSAVTAGLTHKGIPKHPERVTNTLTFLKIYNLKGIRLPSGKKISKKVINFKTLTSPFY